MNTLRRPTVLLAAVIGALLLVGAVAVLVGGDDGEVETTERASVDDAVESSDSSTTASSAPTSGPEQDASDPATTPTSQAGDPAAAPAAGPTTTVTGGDPPQDLGAAQDPGPTSPPKPGTYTYRFESEGSATADQSGEESGESTTTVTDVSREGDIVRQTVDISGGQFDSTSTVEWRPDRVLVTRSIFRFGGQEADCDWTPDYLQAQLPLREGLTWEGRSSCTVTGFGVPITVERTTSNRVSGLERRRIAGRVLDLWVIESDDRITFSTNEIRSQVRSWFSPPLGMIAASEGTVEGSGQQGSGDGRFSTELISLP